MTDFKRRLDGTFVSDLPDVTLADVRAEYGERLREITLWQRMKLSYVDMRAAVRELIAEDPSEARLLFFVLLSDIIFFLSRSLALVISPGAAASEKLPLEIGAILVFVFLARTATLYLFSGAVGAVCRALGGQGSWRDTRTGVFWASLVAAPIGVIGALIGAGMAHLEPYSPILTNAWVTMIPLLIGPVFFVFYLAAGVAEAQRFRNTSPVFMTFSVLTVILLLAGMYVYANFMR